MATLRKLYFDRYCKYQLTADFIEYLWSESPYKHKVYWDAKQYGSHGKESGGWLLKNW